jgi:hypothetical protein
MKFHQIALLMVSAISLVRSGPVLSCENTFMEHYFSVDESSAMIVFRDDREGKYLSFLKSSHELAIRTSEGKSLVDWNRVDRFEYNGISATSGNVRLRFKEGYSWLGKYNTIDFGIANKSSWDKLAAEFQEQLDFVRTDIRQRN